MPVESLGQSDLQFYYFGFYRVLKNFRFMTILGWTIVLAGVAGIPLGWDFGRWHGLIDLVLCMCAIAAGLAVVQQSVFSLDSYVRVPFQQETHGDGREQPSAVVSEIALLMKEVEEGGWQEAYVAIRTLRQLGTAYNLPRLD